MTNDTVMDAIEQAEQDVSPGVATDTETEESPASEYVPGERYTHRLAPGLQFTVREDGKFLCLNCGTKVFDTERGVTMHWNMHCDMNPARDRIRAEMTTKSQESRAANKIDAVTIRSERGKRMRGLNRIPTIVEEIRDRPGGMLGGPAAFYVNPNGATIREALVISPNGAPVVRGGVERGGARDAQQRMANQGYTYVGPTLTKDGIKLLVETVERNRPDFVVFLQESIAQCEHAIQNVDRPEVRDAQRRRREQFQRQLDIARRPIDPAVLIEEMNAVMKAQRLAALTPEQRDAITVMLGDQVDAKLMGLINKMSHRRVDGEDGFSVSVTNATETDEF